MFQSLKIFCFKNLFLFPKKIPQEFIHKKVSHTQPLVNNRSVLLIVRRGIATPKRAREEKKLFHTLAKRAIKIVIKKAHMRHL